MVVDKELTIDLNHIRPTDIIQIHQDDLNSVRLALHITKNDISVNMSAVTIKYDAVINGYLAEFDADGSVADNVVYIPFTDNMVALSGLLKIDIKFIQNNQKLYTQTLSAYINKCIVDGSAVIDLSGTTIGRRLDGIDERIDELEDEIGDFVTDAEMKSYVNYRSGNIIIGNASIHYTNDMSNKQNKKPDGTHELIDSTTGKLHETYTPESGSGTDVQVDGTSIVVQGVANILTSGEYSEDNPLALFGDVLDLDDVKMNKILTVTSGTDYKKVSKNEMFIYNSQLRIRTVDPPPGTQAPLPDDNNSTNISKYVPIVLKDNSGSSVSGIPVGEHFIENEDTRKSLYKRTSGSGALSLQTFIGYLPSKHDLLGTMRFGDDIPSSTPSDFNPAVEENDLYYCKNNQVTYIADSVGPSNIGWKIYSMKVISTAEEPPTQGPYKYELGQQWNYTHNGMLSGSLSSQLYYLVRYWKRVDTDQNVYYDYDWKELTNIDPVRSDSLPPVLTSGSDSYPLFTEYLYNSGDTYRLFKLVNKEYVYAPFPRYKYTWLEINCSVYTPE